MTDRQVPKGQHVLSNFPRMGLPQYLARRVSVPAEPTMRIGGEVARPCEVSLAELASVQRRDQVSDFHCVFTWSRLGLRWGGWTLRDVYEKLIVPRAEPSDNVRYLKFVGLDGFKASLSLDFALADDVLLADSLEGEPLTLEHGAPLRVVAPEHYAYKSVKHLCAIELCRRYPAPFRGGGVVLVHRDGLVDREQRSQLLPASSTGTSAPSPAPPVSEPPAGSRGRGGWAATEHSWLSRIATATLARDTALDAQPRGFEGLGAVEIFLHAFDLVAAKRPNLGQLHFHGNT